MTDETDEVDRDDAQHEYEVTIRAWGPEHEPGEADYHDIVVEAIDKDDAEELAWDEVDLGFHQTGETVQVELLPDTDGQLVTDGGTPATAVDHEGLTAVATMSPDGDGRVAVDPVEGPLSESKILTREQARDLAHELFEAANDAKIQEVREADV